MAQPLHGYRVLDLTRREGGMCAQVLGDLGADVIQVEPPGGIESRRRAPFIAGRNDSEASLTWRAFARGKRSIVIDTAIAADVDALRELICRADFLIESNPVGTPIAPGLDAAALAALNPKLIHVSITPFGSTGPRADWSGSDLVIMAAGGPLAITGDVIDHRCGRVSPKPFNTPRLKALLVQWSRCTNAIVLASGNTSISPRSSASPSAHNPVSWARL